jgi:hypothetical protein
VRSTLNGLSSHRRRVGVQSASFSRSLQLLPRCEWELMTPDGHPTQDEGVRFPSGLLHARTWGQLKNNGAKHRTKTEDDQRAKESLTSVSGRVRKTAISGSNPDGAPFFTLANERLIR